MQVYSLHSFLIIKPEYACVDVHQSHLRCKTSCHHNILLLSETVTERQRAVQVHPEYFHFQTDSTENRKKQ